MGFTTLDWIVLAIYLAASVLIGARFYRRHETASDYLLAGRSIAWFPMAISIIATDLSAISYLGIPALVYKTDIKFLLTTFLFPLQMMLIIKLFIPLFYRLNIFTVYEYLERRFNAPARLFASVLFLFGRIAWIATMTYATGTVLTEITGMPTSWAILICGISTTLYTFLGGMEAVVWTDFMQFFVLVGGALAILAYLVFSFDGGLMQMWNIAADSGHTRAFDFTPSLTRPFTIWALFVGQLVYQLSTYGADQLNVQRYFAARDVKATVRAALGSSLINVPVVVLLYAVGIGFVGYYSQHPELRATLTNVDRIMPHFTVNVLPAGLRGLVIAGVFAATMSSMSAGINSLTTCSMKDLLERISPRFAQREIYWARLLSLFWGVAGTLSALLVANLQVTLAERFNLIYQFFAGPLVGIFLLGVLTKRAAAWPVLIGALFGFAATLATANLTPVHWLWYSPVGCTVTLLLGYAGSLLFRQSNEAAIERYTLAGSQKVEAL